MYHTLLDYKKEYHLKYYKINWINLYQSYLYILNSSDKTSWTQLYY